MSFEPTDADLATFTEVGDIATWLEMDPEVLEALKKATGAKSYSIRLWAKIPAARWAAMLPTVTVADVEAEGGERPVNPVEEGQIGELREILLMLLQRGPPPATGGGGAELPVHPAGGTEGHLPGGGEPTAAGAGAAGSGGQPAGTEGQVPAPGGAEPLAQGVAGRKGTGPIHDARFGPCGDRGVR